MSEPPLHRAVDSPYRAAFDGSFRIDDAPSSVPDKKHSKLQREQRLSELVAEISELQHVLFADKRYSLLLIFQAMDAAGKDSTIRAVLTGVNPAGCSVHAFGRPSEEDLDHDFLWRTACRLPRRGQ